MAPVPDMQGFVPNPSGRGTINILWSCITTLGLCAWTSLHINLPSGLWFLAFRNIRISAQDHRFLVKIWSMFVMILAPEFVLTTAVVEWCRAYHAMRRINRAGLLSATDMWTMDDGFFSVMQGFIHNGKPVHARKIVELIKDKTIPPQPSRAKEIRDKSKSDALGKTLVCAQALWLAIQCLARAIQHLPMSILEFSTIGYVFITIAVNSLYWYKPKDVLMPLEVLSWEGRSEHIDGNFDASARDMASEEVELFFFGRNWWQITFISVCALYGGWHCLAWNFVFPSVAEKWLWRIASILTTLPALILLMAIHARSTLPMQIKDLVFEFFYYCAFILYILSRGFILVEMFIGLRRLPAGVFDTVRWTTFLPHL